MPVRLRSLLFVMLLSPFLVALEVGAETTRCEGRIVEAGMTKQQVLRLCGPPDAEKGRKV